jgi:alkylhydroperoxidase family enzyme
MPDQQIPRLLNRSGKSTGYGNGWTEQRVRGFRTHHDIAVYRDGEWAARGEITLDAAGRIIGVAKMTALRPNQHRGHSRTFRTGKVGSLLSEPRACARTLPGIAVLLAMQSAGSQQPGLLFEVTFMDVATPSITEISLLEADDELFRLANLRTAYYTLLGNLLSHVRTFSGTATRLTLRHGERKETTMAKPAHYTSQVAIPLPSEDAVRRIIGNSYDPEKTLNVIKMFAGTEDMYEATVGLVKAIFQAQGIDPKIREMIILRAAAVLNAPYEWQANTQMAKNAGLSLKEIDAAGSDGPVAGINPEYVLVCKATDELSKSGTLHDGTLSELVNTYGDTIARKLVLMIAWFNLLSRFLNGCRVPLETTDKIGTGTSPLG